MRARVLGSAAGGGLPQWNCACENCTLARAGDVQVSPRTAGLRATASDGSTQLVTPREVDGRRYAAFVIGTSLRLDRLTWLDATGKAFASTTSLPRSGYTQFQP